MKSEIRRIMVPVDFSDPSLYALRYGVTLARQFGAIIEVVHVWDFPPYLGTDVRLSLEEERSPQTLADMAHAKVNEAMREFLNRLDGDQTIQIKRTQCFGNPTKRIAELAEEAGADLIVMATHGRSGMARWVMGSVAESTIRHAMCPVLTVRSSEG